MTVRHVLWFFVGLIVAAGLVMVFRVDEIASGYLKRNDWMRGKYGEHCYPSREAPETITKPIYFETYEECKKTL